MTESSTYRLFLLGAGFSQPAGLPLTAELPALVRQVADHHLATDDGYSHLANAMDRYEEYVAETNPSRAFDFEAYGAWLDWEGRRRSPLGRHREAAGGERHRAGEDDAGGSVDHAGRGGG
jgi:hypothetical protein